MKNTGKNPLKRDDISPMISSNFAAHDIENLLLSLTEKDTIIDQKSHIIEQKSDVIEQQKRRIAVLEEYLRLERARRFGASSEKSSGQHEMIFNDVETEDDIAPTIQALEELKDISDTASPKKRGRKGFSQSIPRHQVHLCLSDEEKSGAIDTFFTVVKEELDIVPPKARVLEYLQEKAVFLDIPTDDSDNSDNVHVEGAVSTAPQRRIVAAKRPLHPLKKCIASIHLLTYIIIAKYCDGVSLYGLESTLKRYGGEITRTAMANWVIRLSLELQPLVNLARDHQLLYDYLQMDETRVKVLKEPGKSPQSDKWMWVSKGGPPDKPVILFDYDSSRGAKVVARLLEGYRGNVQCDGLSSYDVICHKNGLVQLGCFDHARRKFKDAIKVQPKKKGGGPSVADIGLKKINALYRLERKIKDKSAVERYAFRQKIAVPLLADLKRWLDSKLIKAEKGGLTYKAIYYALNQWDKLVRYCDDGRFEISNAGAENAIRPFAVGRRRWLFCDTPQGAHASAIHYSLIETCKANGVCPEAYYNYILPRIAEADTVEKWEALLPWNVKAALQKNPD